MKALVTGASGFIGSHVVRHLLARGVEIRAFMLASTDQRNLRGLDVECRYGTTLDRGAVRRAVRDCDVVYHLAALFAHWVDDPRKLYAVNVEGTRNVLEACLDQGVSRVIHTSSIATVGCARRDSAANEDSAYDGHKRAGHYRHSKYLAECAAREYYHRGLPVVIVCPATPIGEGDSAPTPAARLILQHLQGWTNFLYPSGGSNVVDVEVCALGHVLAAEGGRTGERYILGGRNLTYREIIDTLAQITGFPAPRVRAPSICVVRVARMAELVSRFVTGRAPWVSLEDAWHTAEYRYVDSSKARRELGLPHTDLRRALRKAVRWFLDNDYVKNARRAAALRRRLGSCVSA